MPRCSSRGLAARVSATRCTKPGNNRPAAGQVRLDHPRRDGLVHERARFHGTGPLVDLVHAVPCISEFSVPYLRCCARNCRAYPRLSCDDYRQSHETLISRNASSTASAQLVGIGRQVTRARPGWPLQNDAAPAPAHGGAGRPRAAPCAITVGAMVDLIAGRRAIPRRSWRRRPGRRGGPGGVRGWHWRRACGAPGAGRCPAAGPRGCACSQPTGSAADATRIAMGRLPGRREGQRDGDAADRRSGRQARAACIHMPGGRPAVAACGPARSGSCGRGVAVGCPGVVRRHHRHRRARADGDRGRPAGRARGGR